MKLFRTLSLTIALAGASSLTVYAQAPKAPAEKKAPDAPKADAPKAEISAADAAKVEKFFNELVDAMVKNKDACPKMATAINGVIDKNEKWIKTMAESGKDIPQSTKDKLKLRENDMKDAIMKCGNDKDVGSAMMRLAAMDKPKKAAAPAPEPAKPAAPTPPAKK